MRFILWFCFSIMLCYSQEDLCGEENCCQICCETLQDLAGFGAGGAFVTACTDQCDGDQDNCDDVNAVRGCQAGQAFLDDTVLTVVFDREASNINSTFCCLNDGSLLQADRGTDEFEVCGLSPTTSPSVSPTTSPSKQPTESPTRNPTRNPTTAPSFSPSTSPTNQPTETPTINPTNAPSVSPSTSPTESPTRNPTAAPSASPSTSPTESPTRNPTTAPSVSPSTSPTESPTKNPTTAPSVSPSTSPTESPTRNPSTAPSVSPSTSPTESPTRNPTTNSTSSPTGSPIIFVSEEDSDLVVIIGGAVGIFVLLSLLALCVVCRRKRRTSPSKHNELSVA